MSRSISREQKARLEELEGSLFGGLTAASHGFGRETEEHAERLPAREAQGAGRHGQEDIEDPTLVIWEDKRPTRTGSGGEDSVTDSSADDTSGDESDSNAQSSDGAGDEELDGDRTGEHPAADAHTEDSDAEGAEPLDEARRVSGRSAGPSDARQPVWEDPEDEAAEVDIAALNRLRKLRASDAETVLTGKEYAKRLKQQHKRLHPRTSWASLDKVKKRRREADSEDEPDLDDALEDVLGGANNLLKGRAVLPAGLLEATRLKDANIREPSRATVRSVEFHPSGHLLFTAGLDKSLRFFQVDGIKNPKVQTVFLADLPIHKAAFAQGGSQIIAAGRRKHFYVIDLASAKIERVSNLTNREEKSLENFAVSPLPGQPMVAFLGARGHLPLVSLQSRQIVGQLKMSGSVKSATFTDDGNYLMASGRDGVVHTWDLRTRMCIGRFVDEGTLRGTSLASSPGQRLLAAGSDAGFVNIYNHKVATEAGSGRSGEPTSAAVVPPLKSLKNLVTPIDSLLFSPDGQILAMASSEKRDALRLVHTASMTTFSNWPTSRTPLGLVHSMAFSPQGGFFAMGNSKGSCLLYRLHHYQHA